MSSAHDRLTDPAQRQKEERTAAAKQPKSKPPPPAPAPAAPAPKPQAAPQPNNAHPSQPRPTYDPKTNKWSAEAEWGKFQQPAGNEQSTKAQEAARRKQYYDEILREQFKKAESDRKAKEFAAMRDAAAKQRANPNMAGADAGASNANGGANSAGAGPTPPGGASGPNYYNYSNPYARKPYQKEEGTTGSSSARTDSSTGAGYNPNYPYSSRPHPPSSDVPLSSGAGAGTGVNGAYKTGADGRVHPQHVPLYGKIPSREGPPGTGLHGSSKPGTARTGSAAGSAESTTRPTPQPGAVPTTSAAGSKQPHGIASNADATNNNSSSNNLRSGAKPNANRVPKPYGLRCLFVGANAAELEWVTSKYHRNTLLAELSWRIKEADMNSSFRQPWESASKLISSGKCRKKNLVPGAVYEFRVRAVEELSGGLLGYRSDWSDSIVVTLLPDKTTYSTGSAAAGPTPGISPSHKGLASKGSYYSKSNLKEPSFSFPDTETTERARHAESNQQTASQPNLAKPTPPTQQQPNQPSQPKASHTYERFTAHHRNNDPKSNAYDLNRQSEDLPPTTDGRRSMPSIPVRTPLGGEENAAKNSGRASMNTKEMGKNYSDTTKRGGPAVNLNGSARNVWGAEKENASSATTSSGASEADKSKINKGGVASAPKRGIDRDGGSVSDLEVDEEIADDKESVGTAEEVEDEVNTVGVDEDSSSVHTSSGPYKSGSKPKPSAPINMTKSPPPANSNSYHREKVSHSTDKTAESLRSSMSSRDGKKGGGSGSSSGGGGGSKGGARASKGEFEDITIEVEDGSEDEGEETEEEEDDDDFEMEYEQIYTLIAPAAKVKAKKSASSMSLIYAHPVRAEPVIKSTIIGYLNIGTEVVACADAGNWLKVKIHKQPNRKSKAGETEPEWGWSVRSDKNHEYLKLSHVHASHSELPPLHHPHVTSKGAESPAPTNKSGGANFKSPNGSSYYTPTTPLMDKSASASTLGNPLGNRSMRALPKYPNRHTPPTNNGRASFNEKNVPVWMELFDEGGHAYYFNEATSESKWEPPDWVEERDPATGAK